MHGKRRNEIGSVIGGVFFILLAVWLMIPLPLDGGWFWGSFAGSSQLGFLLGIPLFILGVWMLKTRAVKKKRED
jgi:hypothetical protein